MGGKKSGRWKLAYTPELHKQIVDALERGAYLVHAANAAGVSGTAVHRWVKKGRDGIEKYAQFAEDVDRARANDALRNQAIISAAAVRKVPGDWKAAAWNLERKFPKLYGRRAMMENIDDVQLPPPAADNAAAAGEKDSDAVHSPWLRLQ
jgi:hypothetical protein